MPLRGVVEARRLALGSQWSGREEHSDWSRQPGSPRRGAVIERLNARENQRGGKEEVTAALVAPPFQKVEGADLKGEDPEITESSGGGARALSAHNCCLTNTVRTRIGVPRRFWGWK